MTKDLQKALEMLSSSIYKILKINLTDDTFSIIKIDKSELSDDSGYEESLSSWMEEFSYSGLVHPSDYDNFSELVNVIYLKKYLAENEVFRLSYRRRIGKEFVLVGLEISRAEDFSPDNMTAYVFVKDVTSDHSHQFEQELKLMDALKTEHICIALMHDVISSGLWTFTFDENFQVSDFFISDEYKRMCGYDNTDFSMSMEDWINLFHPDDKEYLIRVFKESKMDFDSRAPFDREFRMLTKAGTYKWFRAAGEFIRDLNGRPYKFIGVTVDIDEKKMLENELKKEQEQFRILQSMSEIYLTTHLVNLKTNTVKEVRSTELVSSILKQRELATDKMQLIMKTLITDQYLEKALEFTDLSTIADRMKGKKMLSAELLGKNQGWIFCNFITIETDSEDRPVKVVFTVTVIDQEKKREEKLVEMSITDELTGLYNRRAYEKEVERLNKTGLPGGFMVISMDLNGLKTVNDTLGHTAGDEMIEGAAFCIKKAFAKKGSCFRMGGDEFLIHLNVAAKDKDKVLDKFQKYVKNWHGKQVAGLAISEGHVHASEFPHLNLKELTKKSDELMYKNKSEFYRASGHDRRQR
ncbi:MAG: diguanylate cyclase [Treponemataceae bacterium]|nr:diguanylate cyclase [Treponemataceae bacterium]